MAIVNLVRSTAECVLLSCFPEQVGSLLGTHKNKLNKSEKDTMNILMPLQ